MVRHVSVCLAALLLAVPVQHARAESFHTCAGFIDAVPATLGTQGTWCLRGDLSTAIASGAAITVATNNVTIDCNGFKLGGLAAGVSTNARGISAYQRSNITVRNCSIRGFRYGIELGGANVAADPLSSGHLVEDNRLDNNTEYGIRVAGVDNTVRRNLVRDTGGRPGSAASLAIAAAGDVIDNTVSGVFATAEDSYAYGINSQGEGGQEIRGNRIRGLIPSGTGYAIAVYTNPNGVRVVDNQMSATRNTPGYAVYSNAADLTCTGNSASNLANGFAVCDVSSHNTTVSLPP